ncbi:MAG: hypothetical protein ACOC0A_04910 [Planctomycetota bacterium]
MKLLSEGTAWDRAFEKSFGADVNAFEKAWHKYVRNLQPSRESQCRANMSSIMQLGREIMGGAQNLTSLSKLHSKLVSDKIRWRMRTQDGREISSEDDRKIAGLFRCPFHKNGGKNSYILLENFETGLPELYCVHHPGNIMRACYDHSAEEDEVRVERVIRETLPKTLIRALRRKTR